MGLKVRLSIKRFFDIMASTFGLVVISPLLLIISIFIKVTSSGPVFFRQERLGKAGKVFKIIKFRTMVVGAQNMGDGLKVKSESDSRITGIGKFLRKTSLDELPQLFNVLKGDMSLVGPRPPVTYHPYTYENYGENQKKRFLMRPGITGLAQVTVRNSVPWDERIKYDVCYVENFTCLQDIKLLIKTIFKILRKESIY